MAPVLLPNCQVGSWCCHWAQIITCSPHITWYALSERVSFWCFNNLCHYWSNWSIYRHVSEAQVDCWVIAGCCWDHYLPWVQEPKETCTAGSPQHDIVVLWPLSFQNSSYLSQYRRGHRQSNSPRRLLAIFAWSSFISLSTYSNFGIELQKGLQDLP